MKMKELHLIYFNIRTDLHDVNKHAPKMYIENKRILYKKIKSKASSRHFNIYILHMLANLIIP